MSRSRIRSANLRRSPPTETAALADVVREPSESARALAASAAGPRSIPETVAVSVLVIGAAVTPVIVSLSGQDAFRLPKELALITAATFTVASIVIGAILRRFRPYIAGRPLTTRLSWVAVGGALWAMVCTAFSTNVSVSVLSLPYGLSVIAVGVAAALLAGRVPVGVFLATVLAPALANACLLFVQTAKASNLLFPAMPFDRTAKTAFLGNPTDVGVYLLAPVLVSAAAALALPRRRGVHTSIAIVLIAALLVTETITAVAALIVGLAATLIMRNRRVGAVAVALIPMFAVAVLILYAPLRARTVAKLDAALAGNVDYVLTGRARIFLAAWEMFKDRPVVGVGPGCFRYHFMEYGVAVTREYPGAAHFGNLIPSHEAHNDHLQLMAETGAPGYLLVIAAFVIVGSASRSRAGPPNSGVRGRMARLTGFPLAAAVAVAMLAQFPLYLAASAYTYAFVAGTMVGWRDADAA